MARVLIIISFCLLASSSALTVFGKNPLKTTITTAAPEIDDDDSIVYHERGDGYMNGQHVTVILNNDSDGDGSEKESSLGVFRVVMDIVMRRAVSELRAQQGSGSSVLTNSIETNAVGNDEQQHQHQSEGSTTPRPLSITTPQPIPTTSSPRPYPPHRCRWCDCWQKCRQRKYYWGICLCGKCHCYY